ncbi:DUF3325 domain-containing protein [Tateyamaria sp. syn59]|uniref:DUF3325 domain-containing protein n=1 Tax=Tateyamaria sp. syn59 TaxID=2576942 RepID=UPI0011BE3B11|nr:DUF3325 domain-containing protein [Tateyamaria sp. syn59]
MSENSVKSANLWIDPVHRVVLSLVGSFVVTLMFVSALTLGIGANASVSTGDSFFWSAYAGIVVFFLASLWCFSARSLGQVWFVFSLVTVLSMLVIYLNGGDQNLGYGPQITKTVLRLLTILTAAIAFAGFALSQLKHWTLVTGEKAICPATSHTFKAIGCSLIALGFALAIIHEGWGFGLLIYPMWAFSGALAVSFTLAYRPRMLRPFARLVRGFTAPFDTDGVESDAP